MSERWQQIVENLHKYSQNKTPWLYLPLLAFYFYLYIHILSYQVNTPNNWALAILYSLELGVHEVSHVATMFLPQIVTLAAGSVGEIALTVLIVVVAWRARAYFAAIFGLLWVALACNSVGNYMADARSQNLDLVGFGSAPIHDWNYIFGRLGWLQHDQGIGTVVRFTGDFIGLLALLFGLWLIYKMPISGKSKTS